ncbi:MAG: DNA-formamidopyrimidine glycosylase [Cytophagaceae bacterium]|nr:DNA-formamidopyrimidine glycosylase [Cytophagaceae bacterium]
MPELPEVETYRRYFEETCLFQPIANLFVEDRKLLTTDYDTLLVGLRDRSFIGTKRVGKNLFVQLDGLPDGESSDGLTAPWLHLHFGMTGDLAYFRDVEDTPRFARILFFFQNGFKLAFICPRKFERVGLIDTPEAYLLRKKIGKDGLEISVEELAEKFRRKAAPIKPVLMDQATVAGLGNWIVDEVLFQARLHPERRANNLTPDEVARLHGAIQLVLTTAITQEAQYSRFPTSFLIHAREWDSSPYPEANAHRSCPACRGELTVKQVGGRTTYFCGACQG